MPQTTTDTIRLSIRSAATTRGAVTHWYAVAGHALAADVPIPFLQPFALPAASTPAIAPAFDALPPPAEMRLLHRDRLWLGQAQRAITCYGHAQGYRLDVEGVGAFAIDAAGKTSAWVEPAPDAPPDGVAEAAIGPALMLALSIRQTWSLHASAVILDGVGVIFTGDSGAGKSTLAHYLDGDETSPLRRIADDVLPIELNGDALVLLPHYPQLKLPVAQQPAAHLPQRITPAVLYVLEGTASTARVMIEPQNPRDATLTLVRHTVATRLFDRDLLARHLAFCAQAGPLLPMRRLVYPRRMEALPALRDRLLQDLQQLRGVGNRE